eukprot:NODE_3576_length_943_cov_6.401961_g3424_i0.p1 GENE.NODE_3576_length_943_cov_6.401961_g3424_i0~~NODE_3576_length_943_cov_6.401961_g3424_i0.p1  ORF type:complete len:292 (+),score=70.35 NODE_3576_length_943_cov_6.401961_g3424_i0:79-876(+)
MELFTHVRPYELIQCSWSRSERKPLARHVAQLMDRFNYFTTWIAQQIITPESHNERQMVMCKWIAIAGHLRLLGNFYSLPAILAAFQHNAVFRMKKALEVPAEFHEKLTDMQELMNWHKNFAAYRECLKQAAPPCLPFLMVLQSDLTKMEECMPTYLRDQVINWEKCAMVGQLVQSFQRYQQIPYTFPLNPPQYAWLRALQGRLSDQALLQLSLQREPRESFISSDGTAVRTRWRWRSPSPSKTQSLISQHKRGNSWSHRRKSGK